MMGIFRKYLSVGVLNTGITFVISTILYSWLNLAYDLAYITGYFFGYLNSMIVNNIYTFKENRNKFGMDYFLKFTFFFILSLIISKFVVDYSVLVINANVIFSFIIGMIIYSIVNYMLLKRFVYN